MRRMAFCTLGSIFSTRSEARVMRRTLGLLQKWGHTETSAFARDFDKSDPR